MPTGYTSDIYNGKEVSFEQFALGCARAFIMSMRDDPADAPIPDEFKPSDYYEKRLGDSKNRLEELNRMSEIEVIKANKKEYEDSIESYKKQIDKNEWLKNRYKNMIEKVNKYNPPSNQYLEFKKFMLDQLERSLKFDCSYKPEFPKMITSTEWKAKELKSAIHGVNYFNEQMEKENERCKNNSNWVKLLKDSIK